MDGIDAALIETDGTSALIRPIGHHHITYPDSFRIMLRDAEAAALACSGMPGKSRFHSVTERSTHKHAEAVSAILKKTGVSPKEIDIIGYHGQTLLHRPQQGISLNIGDGQLLANLCGIPVVNNFRQADIQAGGQGAPLAPLYHQAVALNHGFLPAAVVNCGGIANITLIYGSDPADVVAFDSGPGNALVDRLVRERTQNCEHMDKDGGYGLRGRLNTSVLAELRAEAVWQNGSNYLLMPPPKSLDTHDMLLPPGINTLSIEDACATLEMFTADCIVQSIDLTELPAPAHWILAGGGWRNPCILQYLKTLLHQKLGARTLIKTADQLGQNPEGVEAELFAWLAVRSLKKLPLSMPKTTGVPAPMTGGDYYRPLMVENAEITL